MTDTQRERETKYDVPSGWLLPDPIGLVPTGGSVGADTRSIVSTYYDTAGRDLLAAGVTLRRREGGGDDGWQLKAPDGLARTEYRLPPGRARTVPAELRRLTAGLRGRAALVPLATLRVQRAAVRLLTADGTPLAEIVTDTVAVDLPAGAPGPTDTWTEVEVELLEGGSEKLLRRADALVRAHGARPARSASKIARAVGADAPARPDLRRLSGLLADYLDQQYLAILHGDLELRRGFDGAAGLGTIGGVDVDLVHRTRVATRRYRSVLRVFRRVLDPVRADELDAELAWFAALLGAVRDRHVLRDHLAGSLAELAPELVLGPVSARITETLLAEEAEAVLAVQAALDSARYALLQRQLRQWRAAVPMTRDEPAKRVAAHLRRAERTVDRRLRRARADGDSLLFHRARKAAKRARYTAELARPELGAAARRIGRQAKAVQEHLGDRQDDTLAAHFLRRVGAAAGTTPGENGFTFGLLHERELARARRIRR